MKLRKKIYIILYGAATPRHLDFVLCCLSFLSIAFCILLKTIQTFLINGKFNWLKMLRYIIMGLYKVLADLLRKIKCKCRCFSSIEIEVRGVDVPDDDDDDDDDVT